MTCNIRETLHRFYLLFTPDDKDASEDEAFTQNVTHEAAPEGPEAVQPHSDPQEAQKTHLALTGPIKTPLRAQKRIKPPQSRPTQISPQVLKALPCVHEAAQKKKKNQTFSSKKISPWKYGLKFWISVPTSSLTTAYRGTPS